MEQHKILISSRSKSTVTNTPDELTHHFTSLFHSIGKLKDAEVQLHIDETILPVAQAAHRIPFHLWKRISEELENLKRQGIIEKVEGATLCLSVCGHKDAKQSHPTGETPESDSGWPHPQPEWSNCFLKAWFKSRLSSDSTRSKKSLHHQLCDPQRPPSLHWSEFWHKFR